MNSARYAARTLLPSATYALYARSLASELGVGLCAEERGLGQRLEIGAGQVAVTVGPRKQVERFLPGVALERVPPGGQGIRCQGLHERRRLSHRGDCDTGCAVAPVGLASEGAPPRASHWPGTWARSGGELVLRLADLDRVVDRILAPLEPAAVVDRDPRPGLEVGVEPGLAGAPAGAAVERDPLVGVIPASSQLAAISG